MPGIRPEASAETTGVVLAIVMCAVLFVVAKVAELPFERVTRATAPYLIPLLAVLAAITLWPPLTTSLPSVVLGR